MQEKDIKVSNFNEVENQIPNDLPPPYTATANTTSDANHITRTRSNSSCSSCSSASTLSNTDSYMSTVTKWFNNFTMGNSNCNAGSSKTYGHCGTRSGCGSSTSTDTNYMNSMASYCSMILEERHREKMTRKQERQNRKQERHLKKQERREERQVKKQERRDCNQRNYNSDANSTISYSNTENLSIKRSNTHLVFNENWSGKECKLETANGHIQVHGSLTSTKSIELKSSNGNIMVDGALCAGQDMNIKSSNGMLSVGGDCIIGRDINIKTTNAALKLDNFIECKTLSLSTDNAPIVVRNLFINTELKVKTTNALVEVHVQDIKSSSAKIFVETSNAPVHVYLPKTFSGRFFLKTSSYCNTNIYSDDNPNNILTCSTDKGHYKEGSYTNLGNKSNIEIYIKTSNAPANLYL